jgi:hypothetical protein
MSGGSSTVDRADLKAPDLLGASLLAVAFFNGVDLVKQRARLADKRRSVLGQGHSPRRSGEELRSEPFLYKGSFTSTPVICGEVCRAWRRPR